MTNTIEIKKGDVVYVNLGKAEGNIQGGKRPCVVVQNDVGNKYSPITIIVPLTSQQKQKLINMRKNIISYIYVLLMCTHIERNKLGKFCPYIRSKIKMKYLLTFYKIVV